MDVPSLATLNRIENLLPSYTKSVGLLRDNEYAELEASLLLIKRDLIEDQLSVLNADQLEQLQAADRQLCAKAALAAQALPVPAEHSRSRWWWFLHEGPQVREQAMEISLA